jgi:hypothetical protein
MAGRGMKAKSVKREAHGMSDKAAFQVIVLVSMQVCRSDAFIFWEFESS